LKDLRAVLKTRSRMTVFRRLSTVGYRSSYNHAGRYYTLTDVPEFDEDGLWQHAGVGFSRDGTLKETVVHLVEKAEAGLFHRELQVRLQVRVHNTLADLVEARRIGRERLLGAQGEYLYVGADGARATVQVAHRRLKIEEAAEKSQPAAAEIAPSLVIEVLIEVIHGSVVRLDARQVAGHLAARAIVVTEEQVGDIFRRYGVVKKTAPSPSRRSRR
jgi:hypothetical protein